MELLLLIDLLKFNYLMFTYRIISNGNQNLIQIWKCINIAQLVDFWEE